MGVLCTRVFGAALAALVFTTGAIAMPPDTFRSWTLALREQQASIRDQGGSRGETVALFNRMMDQLDLSELAASQIAWLTEHGLMDYSMLAEGGRRSVEIVVPIVAAARGEASAEGAVAAALYATFASGPDTTVEDNAALLRDAILHPDVEAALRRGDLVVLNELLAYRMPREILAEVAPELGGYVLKLANASPRMALYSDLVYENAADLGALDEAQLSQVHAALLALTDRAIALAAKGDSELADSRAHLRNIRSRLEMAPLVTRLVGAPAPELDFTWSSAETALTSLADRRGKVVVLDFWATWCAPCVATFPNLRALAAHYDGFPVEIIGVTSVQGFTSFGGSRGRVSAPTAADEFTHMVEYMRTKDITWTIAFSEQEVFNPDYGIRGIPHVVLVDPDGVIRHRGLPPAATLEEKVAKIDAILLEFGLPVPQHAQSSPPPAR